MNRFFIDQEIINNQIELTGETAHYIKNVLRLKETEKIIIIKNKIEYIGTLKAIKKENILVEATLNNTTINTENSFNITLFQGIPKGDKMDFIIEKAVETGVDTIVPLKLTRCVSKIDGKDKKIDRFNKIAKSAAQQSGRLVIPIVTAPICINDIKEHFDIKLVCYEDENKTSLKDLLTKQNAKTNIAIVIGPEGGISDDEITQLKEKGFIPVSLGNRILRCETAGLYTIANINYQYNV